MYGDADATKSQDAVITEISEQDVEEASTAEVRSTRPAIEDDANVQIAVGINGDVPAVALNFEQTSSLSQRDGYESREASNGTGLYGYDEKVEAGSLTLNPLKPHTNSSSLPVLLKFWSLLQLFERFCVIFLR